jgi:pyocin large subunit-like protein
MAFCNSRQLNRHFTEHGAEFGAATAQEYQLMADAFLLGPRSPSTLQCIRTRGDLIRFDPTTGAYGVLDSSNVVRTFFKPIPCVLLPPASRILAKQRGRCHNHANNLLYFQWNCQRW